MDTPQASRPSPWLTMWTAPRSTLRHILDTNPTRHVLLLAILFGITQALDRAGDKNLGDSMPFPLVLVCVIISGVIGGIVWLYLGGALLRWTGSWFGGRGTTEQVRAGMAWGSIPMVWTLVLWVVLIAAYREQIFSDSSLWESGNLLAALAALVMAIPAAIVMLVVIVWYIFVFLKSVGEAHGFSAWRALATVVLSSLMIFLPVLVLGLIVGTFM